MEGIYSAGMLIALTDLTDPKNEMEFYNWYKDIKIPEIESLGFIRNTRRFENVLSNTPTYRGRPKYLALWPIFREDIEEAHKEIKKKSRQVVSERSATVSPDETVEYPTFAYVRMVDTLYRRIGPEFRTDRTGRKIFGVHLELCFPTDPAREEEFNEWLNEKHVPDILSLGVYDTAYRYKILHTNDRLPFRPYYANIYETSNDPLEALKIYTDCRAKWLEDKVWVELFGVYWAGSFRQIYPPR